jgi:hypothetical protein
MLKVTVAAEGVSIAAATPGALPTLASDTLAGWERYVGATEQRQGRELADGARFFTFDFDREAPGHRAAIAGGALHIEDMESIDARGEAIDVPSAMVHHWRGAVLIPGVTLPDLLARLRSGPPPGMPEDVLAARVLDSGPDRQRLYLRLKRTKFVTVVFDTEHDTRFRRHSARRASSATVATRIVELQDPGTPDERAVAPGDDRGFLRRWRNYWRYEEVQGGVIAECESISLSRGVPSLLRYVAGPLIRSTARESMERTLIALRDGYRR